MVIDDAETTEMSPTDIPVSERVIARAQAESPTRGQRKMEIIRERIAAKIPDGEEIVDWKRDEGGKLIAVTAPIPQEEPE